MILTITITIQIPVPLMTEGLLMIDRLNSDEQENRYFGQEW